jgi:DNA polymerase-3 subunit delta'
VIELLARLPATDPRALHALGDSLDRGDDDLFDIFVETARAWLSQRLDRTAEPGRLVVVADAWDRLNSAARDAEIYNLERKPLVFNVFGLLAEAARG